MIEIDHTAPSKPEQARPILASHLLAVEEKQRKRFAERGERIKTGCAGLDEYVLGGGFERGIVVGLSGEGTEGRLISLNLLVSVLLSHLPRTTDPPPTKPITTIIDTTGSFPISLLASIITSRYLSTRNSRSLNQVTSGNHETRNHQRTGDIDVEKETQRCLEMVAISRVFDIEGLWEVLGEVGMSPPGVEDSGAGAERKEAAKVQNSTDFQAQAEQSAQALPRRDNGETYDQGTEIIVIDTMSHIINELFSRKEKSESHALLTLLSRSLHSITQTANILTILHNGTIPSKSTYPKTTPPPPIPLPPSIFSGNPVKPALGRIFDSFTALHLLTSQMPKTKEDAELLYAHNPDSPLDTHQPEYCTVIEIIKDETPDLGTGMLATREQRWCALGVSRDGLHLVPAFQEENGRTRRTPLNTERGEIQDVGSVAKIYGFGGRRV